MITHATCTLDQALAMGPPPEGRLSIPVLERGSLEVRFYAPQEVDAQTPHPRDEVYVVASGHAQFDGPDGARAVASGAMIFVAAGTTHHFTDLSSDFAVWVMFYGPDGGEHAASR